VLKCEHFKKCVVINFYKLNFTMLLSIKLAWFERIFCYWAVMYVSKQLDYLVWGFNLILLDFVVPIKFQPWNTPNLRCWHSLLFLSCTVILYYSCYPLASKVHVLFPHCEWMISPLWMNDIFSYRIFQCYACVFETPSVVFLALYKMIDICYHSS